MTTIWCLAVGRWRRRCPDSSPRSGQVALRGAKARERPPPLAVLTAAAPATALVIMDLTHLQAITHRPSLSDQHPLEKHPAGQT